MTSPWERREPGDRTRGSRAFAVIALTVLAVVGCGLTKPVPLDVPPGHSIVLGRLDLTTADVGQAIFDIVKDDGTLHYELAAGPSREDFALPLPNGRYSIARVRTVKEGGVGFPNSAVSELRVAFEAGPEPAAYIGTIRLQAEFRQRFAVTVTDEYAQTLAVLRGRYADLPGVIVRRLATPA